LSAALDVWQESKCASFAARAWEPGEARIPPAGDEAGTDEDARKRIACRYVARPAWGKRFCVQWHGGHAASGCSERFRAAHRRDEPLPAQLLSWGAVLLVVPAVARRRIAGAPARSLRISSNSPHPSARCLGLGLRLMCRGVAPAGAPLLPPLSSSMPGAHARLSPAVARPPLPRAPDADVHRDLATDHRARSAPVPRVVASAVPSIRAARGSFPAPPPPSLPATAPPPEPLFSDLEFGLRADVVDTTMRKS